MTRFQINFQGRPKFSGIVFQVKLKIFLELSKNNYPFWLEWNSVSYLINLRPISIEYYLHICSNIEFTVFFSLISTFYARSASQGILVLCGCKVGVIRIKRGNHLAMSVCLSDLLSVCLPINTFQGIGVEQSEPNWHRCFWR